MKQIIINSNNNVVRNFVAEDTDTIYNVLNSTAVLDMFAANADTIINALEEINSSSVPDAFKNMLINSEVEDGMSLFINLEAIANNFDTDNEEDNQQEDYNEQHTEAPHYGTVSVYAGLQTLAVRITPEVTTLKEVLTSDVVAGATAMDEEMIFRCRVEVNYNEINRETASQYTLKDGDFVSISPRAAATKAC